MMNGEIKNIKPLSGQMPSPKTLGGDIGGKIINIGEDGATFVPNMSENGILSWTNNKNLENPPPVNIKGKDGKDGKDGANGKDGINGIDGKDGAPGKDGIDGKDGFSPIVSVTDIEGGHKVTIADKEGEKTFDVMDGKDGQGGGGVTSWNDLADKPFGETPPAFDITWDGNIDGHENFQADENAFFVKVSDEVFTKEQLLNSTMYRSDGHVDTFSEENIAVEDEAGLISLGDIFVIFSAEAFIGATGLPEGSFSNGVWFVNWTGEEPHYVNRFVAPTTIKKLDNKYLDLEGLSPVATSGSWNDLTDKPSFAVVAGSGDYADLTNVPVGVDLKYHLEETQVTFKSTQVLLSSDAWGRLFNGANKISFNGELFDTSPECTNEADIIGNPYLYDNSKEDNGIPIVFVLKRRVSYYYNLWIYTRDVYVGQTCTVAIIQANIKLLDEKFLPDSVVLESELEGKGYQTEEQVTALINNALGVIENGSY